MASLKQAGIEGKDIDAVVMSHAHIDHCGGCMADDGTRHFPNAQYYIAQADYDFWTDETKVPKDFKVFWETAVKNLKPNRDRMVFFKDGQEFLPGITAISAPGPHGRPHHLHDLIGRQAAQLHRRSDASSGAPAREAAHRVHV
jgi:glyoxylase-like metal-dependent hydrolase (beta-lactamase superfamily II)